MKLKVDLTHSEYGAIDTTVEIAIGPTDEITAYYPEIVERACKNAASRYVQFESFGSDSAYLEALETAAEQFSIATVTVVDAGPDKRWAFYALHTGNDGDTFADNCMAPTRQVADFYARWAVAVSESADPNEPDDFMDTMELVGLPDLYEEPIKKEEAIAELREFQIAARAAIEQLGSGVLVAFEALLANTKLPEEP